MAVLSSVELATLRNKMEALGDEVNYTKLEVNLALQAVEDWFEANRSGIATVIDTATSPFVFTATQKKRLVKFYLFQKSNREST